MNRNIKKKQWLNALRKLSQVAEKTWESKSLDLTDKCIFEIIFLQRLNCFSPGWEEMAKSLATENCFSNAYYMKEWRLVV